MFCAIVDFERIVIREVLVQSEEAVTGGWSFSLRHVCLDIEESNISRGIGELRSVHADACRAVCP